MIRIKREGSDEIVKENLGYLDERYQRGIIKQFIEDSSFFASICNIVDQNSFSGDWLKRLVGYIKDLFNDTGRTPTYEELKMYINAKESGKIALDTLTALLDDIRNMSSEGKDILKEEVDNFFKQQNLIKVINIATRIVKDGDFSKYYSIGDMVNEALGISSKQIEGFNPMDGIDDALEDNYRNAIPTGYSRLDRALSGGLGAGELGIIVAPSGVGKTSITTGFAASAATYQCKANDNKGYKVVHIYFEDENVNIKRKYYGWLTNVDASNLSKPEFREGVKKRLQSDLYNDAKMIQDNVWCFHLPSGEFTVRQIEQIIKQGILRGFDPDLVIIDYFECLKHEIMSRNESEWTMEGNTMRQLEALAHKHNIALWVPIQGTKDSFDKEILGLSSAGGSVKKVQIGHVIITLARTQEQKRSRCVTLSVEKFRAGLPEDSVMANVGFNNGTCRFAEDQDGVSKITLNSDNNGVVDDVRQKALDEAFNEIQKAI